MKLLSSLVGYSNLSIMNRGGRWVGSVSEVLSGVTLIVSSAGLAR